MTPQQIAAKLKYGTAFHNKVRDAVQARLRLSESKFKSRYEQLARNEETFQAYIPEKDVDALRRRDREENGTPSYRTIELPHTYAVVMTAHTYYTSVFLARNPILQLSTRHGEPEQSRVAVEALLAYQLQIGMNILPLFIWLLDPAKYGFGVIGTYWDVEMTRVRKFQTGPRMLLGMPIPGTQHTYETQEDLIGYEGARVYNVRPQDFFPDPRVALVHFQRGEFCDRYVEVPWNDIYSGQSNARYFNYDTLKAMRARQENQNAGDPTRDVGSSRVTALPGGDAAEAGYDVPVGFIKSHECYLKLIPKEWGLADSDKQEIWVFSITTNGVVFGCTPLGEYHNKFPFDILVDEVDGYSIAPKSMVERVKPLNDVMTWLINTHFYNVRAALNNQWLVDPSMVVMKDVENPNPGKIIRLKPEAYGKDVRQMIQQLAVADVTKGHISADLGVIIDFIARMSGTNDNIMGMINQGGRKTATEVRTSSSFGINRLKTMCEWHSTVGFGPFTQKLVQQSQQHYDTAKKLRLVGDLAQFDPNGAFANVDPQSIAGFYDYEPVDGTLPIDRFAQANLWQMIMTNMEKMPAVMMQYDVAKIFAWVAQLAGIKNISQFKITDPAVLQTQLQAGNVVPLNTAMGETKLPMPQLRGVGGGAAGRVS